MNNLKMKTLSGRGVLDEKRKILISLIIFGLFILIVSLPRVLVSEGVIGSETAILIQKVLENIHY